MQYPTGPELGDPGTDLANFLRFFGTVNPKEKRKWVEGFRENPLLDIVPSLQLDRQTQTCRMPSFIIYDGGAPARLTARVVD